MDQDLRVRTLIVGTLSLIISTFYCLIFSTVITQINAEEDSSRYKDVPNLTIGLVGFALLLLSSILLLIGVVVRKSLLLLPWIISFPIGLAVNIGRRIIYAENVEEQLVVILSFCLGILALSILSMKIVVKHFKELLKKNVKDANDANEIAANSLALSRWSASHLTKAKEEKFKIRYIQEPAKYFISVSKYKLVSTRFVTSI